MGSDLFVDTSGWASIIHRQDPFHGEADRIYRDAYHQGHRILTTDYVISELVPLLGSHYRLARPLVIAAIDVLMTDQHITLLRTDPATFDEAWTLLRQRQDKAWSQTDAHQFHLYAAARSGRSLDERSPLRASRVCPPAHALILVSVW